MVGLHAYARRADGSVASTPLPFASADVVVRHLDVGSWGMTIPHGEAVAEMTEPGGGCVFVMNGTPVLSGRWTTAQLDASGSGSLWTLTGESDAAVLRALGWPVPSAALTAQSSKFWRNTAAAETVIKAFVQANLVDRLGVDMTVAASTGRGASVPGRLRFSSLLEYAQKLGDIGGIGWSVLDSGDGIVFDCYEPVDREGEVLLSSGTGSLQEFSYVRTAPTVTRVIVGDEEASTTRKFRQRTATAAETEWGIIREDFNDQRGTNLNAELDQAGDEVLSEGADRTTVTIKVADIDGQRYAVNYQVGDVVPVQVGSVATFSDVVWEARISAGESGVTVAPTIGRQEEQTTTRALRRLGRDVRQMQEAL